MEQSIPRVTRGADLCEASSQTSQQREAEEWQSQSVVREQHCGERPGARQAPEPARVEGGQFSERGLAPKQRLETPGLEDTAFRHCKADGKPTRYLVCLFPALPSASSATHVPSLTAVTPACKLLPLQYCSVRSSYQLSKPQLWSFHTTTTQDTHDAALSFIMG